ncbi:MAG: hypothetical protein J1F38_03825 [Muribaculaceae bacterium]|nr:hypothetical protein [Muribaculaceae bacterium]
MDTGNKRMNIADIFLDILTKSPDKGTQLMAERIKTAIKVPEILELLNIAVINEIGFKYTINRKTIDKAIDGIIEHINFDIDNCNLSKEDKKKEKEKAQLVIKLIKDKIIESLIRSNQLLDN